MMTETTMAARTDQKWSAALIRRMTRLADQEMSAAQIAKALGLTRGQVLGKMHRLGLKTKNPPRKWLTTALVEKLTKLIGQQPGDMSVLENQLHLNEVALAAIKRFTSPQKGRYAEMLLVIGEKSETTQTVRLVPTPIDYWICTTYPRERAYRAWCLARNPEQPLLECYGELARRLPQGLAGLPQLPEELSGAVHANEGVHA